MQIISQQLRQAGNSKKAQGELNQLLN